MTLLADLERRLSEMPDDLEHFFMAMLNSIEKIYWESSSMMLLACIAAVEPLPIGVFNLLDGRYRSACIKLAPSDTVLELDSLDDIRRRINARCTDLVEISYPTPPKKVGGLVSSIEYEVCQHKVIEHYFLLFHALALKTAYSQCYSSLSAMALLY